MRFPGVENGKFDTRQQPTAFDPDQYPEKRPLISFLRGDLAATSARYTAAGPCDGCLQAFSRLSAARFRKWTRRDVSSAMTPDCTSWVKVRDTVSIVNPK